MYRMRNADNTAGNTGETQVPQAEHRRNTGNTGPKQVVRERHTWGFIERTKPHYRKPEKSKRIPYMPHRTSAGDGRKIPIFRKYTCNTGGTQVAQAKPGKFQLTQDYFRPKPTIFR